MKKKYSPSEWAKLTCPITSKQIKDIQDFRKYMFSVFMYEEINSQNSKPQPVTRDELERYVIGMFLWNYNNILEVNLSLSDFKNERYKTIYESIFTIYHNSKEKLSLTDFTLTVKTHLDITGKLDSIGGEAELVSLQDYIPDSTSQKRLRIIAKRLKELK